LRKHKDQEWEVLEQQFLQEIALSILETAREPILLSAQADDVLHMKRTVEHVIDELSNYVLPLLELSPRYIEVLPYAIQSLKTARENRKRSVNTPFKVHKDCIIERA